MLVNCLDGLLEQAGQFVGRKEKPISYGTGFNAGLKRLPIVHLSKCGENETKVDLGDFVRY